MNIAIIGAGAIGGYLGARLAAAGNAVTFIARGGNLAALKEHGIKLIMPDGEVVQVREVNAYERPEDAGQQDLVLLAVKANQVTPIASNINFLLKADTPIVTLQNGIPWWYFHKYGSPYEGRHIEAADPGGIIMRTIDPERIVGSVVYPAAHLSAPGVVHVVEGNRFSLGELDGRKTPRLQAMAELLGSAGFKAPLLEDIRSEIWLKLWGNLAFNPISALTHAMLVEICQFPSTRELSAEMMREAEAIATKLRVTFRVGIEKRISGAERVGAHKTSMLQDVEQGRAIELEALVGSVLELAVLTGTPAPSIGAVYACASLLARTLERQQGRIVITPARI